MERMHRIKVKNTWMWEQIGKEAERFSSPSKD